MYNKHTTKQWMDVFRKYIVLFVLYWVTVTTLLILLLSGVVKIGCEGICIDKSGRIYVGLSEEIRIYDEAGKLLHKVSPQTSKGYVFAAKNGKLLVDAASTSYVMDLNGEILEQKPYPQLPGVMKTPRLVSADGKIYRITRSVFFYRVVVEQDGEKTVAVETPASDLAAEIVLFAAILMFLVTMVFLFCDLAKHNLLTGWSGSKLNKDSDQEGKDSAIDDH